LDTLGLGKTELMVTRLGLGGIPIQRRTEDEAVEVVRRCLELGINFLDTANGYTTSEERIGKAVKGHRHEVIIATKSGAREPGELKKHLDLSLKRLDTDYIDLYQFHQVGDFPTMEKVVDPESGLMPVLEEAKKAGKIRHIGVTSHQIDVAKALVKTDLFETLMFPFNFITCEPAEELLPLCKEHDVGFIDMKPLAGGMLSNATIAFKYLFRFPDIALIPGIEKVEEIEEIAGLLAGPHQMTPEESAEMERMRAELGTRFCRRCDYCQPCTMGIPISMVVTFPSFVKRLPPNWYMDNPRIRVEMEKATACSECGECEPRCPYGLPIREMVAEGYRLFDDIRREYERK
jgi:aryl-alcohol dehydrogenase-like predicted oxidoreductase